MINRSIKTVMEVSKILGLLLLYTATAFAEFTVGEPLARNVWETFQGRTMLFVLLIFVGVWVIRAATGHFNWYMLGGILLAALFLFGGGAELLIQQAA